LNFRSSFYDLVRDIEGQKHNFKSVI